MGGWHSIIYGVSLLQGIYWREDLGGHRRVISIWVSRLRGHIKMFPNIRYQGIWYDKTYQVRFERCILENSTGGNYLSVPLISMLLTWSIHSIRAYPFNSSPLRSHHKNLADCKIVTLWPRGGSLRTRCAYDVIREKHALSSSIPVCYFKWYRMQKFYPF